MELKVENLHKSFDGQEVLHGISFSIQSGKALGLLGRNGAGKTTTIRILMDVFKANEGTIFIDGKPFHPSEYKIGYMPEERGMYPKKRVDEQLIYFAQLRGIKKAEAKKEAQRWLDRLHIKEYEHRKLETLSKGNQQKIQLMAALISDPELLVLDEPLSGLDPVNTDLFKSIIREEIAKKKYLIMSSHQMPVIEEFCSDITILNRGKAVLTGNLNQIKKSYGRVNLFVKCEGDIERYIGQFGLTVANRTPEEYHLKVQDESQAMAFLGRLVQDNVTVIHFELREPSLHEIFVEKVGGAHEE